MKVKANSVTFPDGSRVGTLVVSPVTADKLPMAPPAGGAQFGVPAWTIQPAGTRFDPPIEVTLPNASSQPPGDNLPIVQWDHDLGQYTAMGRATASEDGSVLVTDSGSGLTKAGWGGLCRYDPDKCAKEALKCGVCERLSTGDCPTCEPDPTKDGKGKELKLASGWSFGFESPFKSLPIRGGANFEAVYEGVLKDKCCKGTGQLGSASAVAGNGTLGVTAEGRIWGWDWHIGVDGEVGLFLGGRVAGGLKAELERDRCENETTLKSISGVITGEIGAYAKLEVNGGKNAGDYGLSVKPLAAVAEAEINYFSTGPNTCASQVKLAGTVKSEVEFGSRKFTVFSFSKTIEIGPYPEVGICRYLTSSTTFD